MVLDHDQLNSNADILSDVLLMLVKVFNVTWNEAESTSASDVRRRAFVRDVG